MTSVEVNGEAVRAAVRAFEGLESQRAAHEARVAAIAGDLVRSLQGETGNAAQKALTDYLAASHALRKEEQEMNAKMDAAVNAYDSVDDAAAGGLEHQMGI